MILPQELRCNVKSVKYSPCGKFIAFGYFDEVTIMTTCDKVVVFKSSCSGIIKSTAWSCDSKYILCVLGNQKVEVFSLKFRTWVCGIRESDLGLHTAVWSPKTYHILTVSQFSERISIWSFIGRSVAFIDNPLMKQTDKLPFSSTGKYLSVVVGNFEKYKISILSTRSWIVVKNIHCSNAISVPSLPLWSPNDCYVTIWETGDLEKPYLEVYSTQDGALLGHFDNVTGDLIEICSVAWSPNSQLLFIGCNDESVYVLNYITWSVIYTLKHCEVLHEQTVQVYHANIDDMLLVHDRPVVFTSIASTNLPGVYRIAFSTNGMYVATQSKIMPAVVWVWDLDTFSLKSVIISRSKVTDLKWSSWKSQLLICTKSSHVTIWNPDGLNYIRLMNCSLRNDVLIREGCPCPSRRQQSLILFTSYSMYVITKSDNVVNEFF